MLQAPVIFSSVVTLKVVSLHLSELQRHLEMKNSTFKSKDSLNHLVLIPGDILSHSEHFACCQVR